MVREDVVKILEKTENHFRKKIDINEQDILTKQGMNVEKQSL